MKVAHLTVCDNLIYIYTLKYKLVFSSTISRALTWVFSGSNVVVNVVADKDFRGGEVVWGNFH